MIAYSDNVGKGTAKISERFINSLVRDIEYYKLKNGSYPNSLEQLSSNDNIVQIYDPILTRRPGANETKFNYKKTGDTYILFSSGLDRIANTKDDIYPTESLNNISKPDSSKH